MVHDILLRHVLSAHASRAQWTEIGDPGAGPSTLAGPAEDPSAGPPTLAGTAADSPGDVLPIATPTAGGSLPPVQEWTERMLAEWCHIKKIKSYTQLKKGGLNKLRDFVQSRIVRVLLTSQDFAGRERKFLSSAKRPSMS